MSRAALPLAAVTVAAVLLSNGDAAVAIGPALAAVAFMALLFAPLRSCVFSLVFLSLIADAPQDNPMSGHWHSPLYALGQVLCSNWSGTFGISALPFSGIDVAGFYSLSPSGRSWQLDHLWVLPRFMRVGVGRALLSHALETAARGGAVEVTVDADPNAELFYLECGAVRRGAVPAPLPGQPGRARPQLAFNARAS